MTSAQIEIQLIAIVVAAACALPGVFLVLRRMAMMSDAISHTVLAMFRRPSATRTKSLVIRSLWWGRRRLAWSPWRWWSC